MSDKREILPQIIIDKITIIISHLALLFLLFDFDLLVKYSFPQNFHVTYKYTKLPPKISFVLQGGSILSKLCGLGPVGFPIE
jgi:hypothetical protein